MSRNYSKSNLVYERGERKREAKKMYRDRILINYEGNLDEYIMEQEEEELTSCVTKRERDG